MERQIIKVLSDYTPASEPNFLQIIKDDQGDFHFNLVITNHSEHGVRIANSGTRHSPKVREAFQNLLEVYQEEIATTRSSEIKELNQ